MTLQCGAPLSRLRPQVGPEELLELVGQACAANHAMHQQGWAHLDIKPDTCLVFREGGRRVLRLADPGLARSMYPGTGLCNAEGKWWCAPAPLPAPACLQV